MIRLLRTFVSVIASVLAAAGLFGSLAVAAPRAAETKSVTIQNFAFAPKDLTVNVGDTVAWTNQDQATHTVTSSTSGVSFDSGRLDTGKSFSFTFDKAGTFSYVCSFHPRMTATIVVQEAGAPAAAPTAQAAPAAAPAGKAAIEVDNQPLINNSITVKEVYADQTGWMVVHVDENGKPGKVIGQTAVKQGESQNVAIKLTTPVADGAKLWPMLHIDAGAAGVYEFPGPDVPATDASGAVVMKQITVSAAASASAPAQLPRTGADGPDVAALLAGAGLLLIVGLALVVAMRRRTPGGMR